jgi:ABC-type sugar transport system ATPase subunit
MCETARRNQPSRSWKSATLRGRSKPKTASLVLHEGEVLGIAGLVGAGRTELLRCLFGLDRVYSGEIKVFQPT